MRSDSVTGEKTYTHVTDPMPTPEATDQRPRCEFKLYPTPDEVLFCERAAAAVLIAPCCGQTTNICSECIGKGPLLGSWLCLGCGVTTDCKWTPLDFGIS